MENVQTSAGTTAANRVEVKTTFSPIEVTRVYPSKVKEGVLVAELKQTENTVSLYPEKSVSNSHRDNIFAVEDFGYGKKEYKSSSTRVDWIDVPPGSTVESVAAQLAKFPEARIYKVLANKPIVTDTQLYALKQGTLNVSMDSLANSQVVRYGENHEDEALRGKLILKDGKPQYKATFFKTTTIADEDRRTATPGDYYASPEIAKELAAMFPETASQDNPVNANLMGADHKL